MIDYDGDTHVYIQIAEALRNRAAELTAGQPMPSEAEIQQEFGVARTTARRAIHMLREEGLIYTVQGEGTFVGSPEDAPRAVRKMPLYRQIAHDLRERITSGQLQPRRPVPPESTIQQQYDVARETVRRAMALLREEGWIYTVPARGSFVSPEDDWPKKR
ncbi:GntR family transcriptional regulator [Nonomuraea sp. NPDC050790]|uniref:GntR family transcriptional regulator n=1 Tax=Nonomuraea sp. NPDC050790 TaxID=3364371 RepID=UPI00379C5F97